jgi:outer membrane lipoprotein-sorting protein
VDGLTYNPVEVIGMIKPKRRHILMLCLPIACLLVVGSACTKKTDPPQANAKQAASDPNAQIDGILQRYQAALGGQEAIEHVVSYHGKGTFSTSVSTLTGSYEVWGKDPDKTLSIITFPQSIEIKKGYDGTTRWVQTPTGAVIDANQNEMAEVERDADIYRVGKIRALYETMRMEPKARLHGHDVYVIEGIPVRGPSDKLFFDEKDGLLLRWDMVRKNPKRGNVFVKVHLDDYREVDGVKVPFKIRFAFESFDLTLTMDELKHNVAIDDSLFKKPGT